LKQAARWYDPERAIDAVSAKVEATTAAVAGLLLLARGGQLARVGHWPRNLKNLFPTNPDGAVLWAEALRAALARDDKDFYEVQDPKSAMVDALSKLIVCGIPFFADSLDLADGLVRYLRRTMLTDEQCARVEQVSTFLELVFRIATPSGQFTMLSGLPRPPEFGNSDEPLSVEEMLRVLRPGITAGSRTRPQ